MSILEQRSRTTTAGNTKPAVKKNRGYFITFWIRDYPQFLPESPQCQYLCTCEDETKDGKWHGHAFIYFKNPVTMSCIKKLFGNDCHVEKPHKNSECIAYVMDKTKRKHDWFEIGTRPMDNGVHRMEDVLECDSIDQVKEQFPDTYVKFRKGIIDLMEHKKSKNRYFKEPEVIWICGSTGSGKTRRAFEDGAMNVTYENGFFSDWGDARCICIEEFRGQIPYAEILKLLDGYHNYYFVNIKGGQKLIDLDKIYITSPYMPEMCYPKQNEKIDSIKQLMRRITELVNTDI